MARITSDGIIYGNYIEQNTAQYPSFRNLIINGDMRICQRNSTGVFPKSTNTSEYTLDRWIYSKDTFETSAVTISRELDAPPGFTYSLYQTVTTARATLTSSDIAVIQQRIEGYNAKELIINAFTISFWVKSSKVGIYCVNVGPDTSDKYIKEYSINTANTWEFKSFTVPKRVLIPFFLETDYFSETTNQTGCILSFVMCAGSSRNDGVPNIWNSFSSTYSTSNQVNGLDAIGNIFAITGVQLEKSPGATPFEFRNYEIEYLLCQRYYSTSSASVRWQSPGAGQTAVTPLYWPVVMRVAPSVTVIGATADSNITTKYALNITEYGAGFAASSLAAGNAYAVYYTAHANAEL